MIGRNLILKELHGVVKIDKVIRAPPGKEVEECTPLEISEILKDAFSPEIASTTAISQYITINMHYDRRHYRREREPREEYRAHCASAGSPTVSEPSKKLLLRIALMSTAVRDVYPQLNETLEAVCARWVDEYFVKGAGV